jgi:hypothetical protein
VKLIGYQKPTTLQVRHDKKIQPNRSS